MEQKSGARGIDDEAALDNPQAIGHTEAQAFEECGEMPRVDELAVDRGLPADGFEAATIEERWE
jgi:hypothetical protein